MVLGLGTRQEISNDPKRYNLLGLYIRIVVFFEQARLSFFGFDGACATNQ
jgi:hypothetical protein